jgi:hypothetical protein
MIDMTGERAQLPTQDPAAQLAFDGRYWVEGYLTCQLMVQSGNFRGAASFCMPDPALREFVQTLGQMSATLDGTARLSDSDSDAFVEMTTNRFGHVTVRGRVGGSHEAQSMTFEFRTDQTSLAPFAAEMETLLEASSRRIKD